MKLLLHLALGVVCASMDIVFVRLFYGMRDRFFVACPSRPK